MSRWAATAAHLLDPTTAYDNYIVPQGIGADLIATIEGFSREDVDAFAAESQERAENAWNGGYFAKSVVPVRDINGVIVLDHDEHRRPGSTVESLGKLKPAFAALAEMAGFDDVALQVPQRREDRPRSRTGGNSSGIVDGASLVLIGSEGSGQAQRAHPARSRRLLRGDRFRAHHHAHRSTPATELALKRPD